MRRRRRGRPLQRAPVPGIAGFVAQFVAAPEAGAGGRAGRLVLGLVAAQAAHVADGLADLLEGIDGSLRRLDTDYVDLVYCHRSDPTTPIEETVWAMHDIVRSGKALYWGTSEWEAAEILAALEARVGNPPETEFETAHEQRETKHNKKRAEHDLANVRDLLMQDRELDQLSMIPK